MVNGTEYDHVVLTPDEEIQALRVAKKKKYYHEVNKRYSEELKRETTDQAYDAVQMLSMIVEKAKNNDLGFGVDQFNEEIIENLCLYFTGNPGKYDLKKGLLIFGNVGCGKTTLMRLFNENPHGSFRIVPCKRLADEILKAGNDADQVLNSYSRLSSNTLIARRFNNGSNLGWCFDDLGTEDNVKSYGNQRNVMADILLRCYDNNTLRGRIHITTNLPRSMYLNEAGQEILGIKEIYGDRVVSRISEMFNEVEFPLSAPDYRKLNNQKKNTQ